MTNEWLDATAIIAGNETNVFPFNYPSFNLHFYNYFLNVYCAEGPVDSNPSTVFDEEGLPSPPLDEGALFASKTPIKLSQV